MRNSTVMLALLYIFCWTSLSVCEFHTVELQPGEEVTLMCSNFSSFPAHISWFILDNKPNATRISSMFSPESNVTLREGFQHGRFVMSSNTTNIFLKIKQVNFSDSGLYFCGFYKDGDPVIFTATYLQVKVSPVNLVKGPTDLLSIILGSVTVILLMVVICLTVKIRTFQTAKAENQDQQQSQNLDSDNMNYAALRFNMRPEAERELDMNVVYAATRRTRSEQKQ